MGSMPPPLIPLPSPTHHSDPSDPFDNLFSDIPLSKPIFIPAKSSERMKRNDLPHSPASANSDFGAFVSVPPSMDPLQQPLVDMDTQTTMSSAYHHQGSPTSDFFERFAVGAKERSEKNERRVLDELLEHEDDPLYWIDSQNSHTESTPEVKADTLIELDDPPPAAGITSLRHTPDSERASRSHSSQSNSRTSPPPNHYAYSPPSASNTASTLPRKWMSTFLSGSLPSSTEGKHGLATFPTPNLKHGIPRVTHSSPFAPHIYVAPSGAPGFAGDHHWNKAGFEFEDRDTKLGVVELAGRRDATTPVLTSQLADKVTSMGLCYLLS